MLDLIVTGGIAVLPSGAAAADIGVANGKIAAIGMPGSLQSTGAARTVDASNQIVIPAVWIRTSIAVRRSPFPAATRIC